MPSIQNAPSNPDLQAPSTVAAADDSARARQQTLAKLIHELTTPLHGMLGLTGLLMSASELGPEHRRKLALIEECGRQQMRLIHDILDFARMDARMLRIHKSVTPLRAMMQSVIDAMAPQAEAGHVTLTAHVADAVPHSAYVDALRLRQVLDNLMSNALKFSAHRGVELRVDVAEGRGHGSLASPALRFTVSDSGRGMTPAQLASIGHLFERGPDEAGLPLGHGIGLFVTRELITLMGGELQLTSTLGQGTEATFVIPLH